MIEVKDYYIGENFVNEIKCIVEDFGIFNILVLGIIIDNVVNMVIMIIYFDWLYICCFVYILQLSVKVGFKIKEIFSVVVVVRKFVGYFKRSFLVFNEFKFCQRQLDLLEYILF